MAGLVINMLFKIFRKRKNPKQGFEKAVSNSNSAELQILLYEYWHGREDLRQKYGHYAALLAFYATGAAALGSYALSPKHNLYFILFTIFILVLMTTIAITFYNAYVIKKHLEYLEFQLNNVYLSQNSEHRMIWFNTIMPKHMGSYRPGDLFYTVSIYTFVGIVFIAWLLGTVESMQAIYSLYSGKYLTIIDNAYNLGFILPTIFMLVSIIYMLTIAILYGVFRKRAQKGFPIIEDFLKDYKTKHV